MEQTESKVVPINRAKFAVFTPELRGQLESAVQPFTDKEPAVVIATLENTICRFLVVQARAAGTALWNAIADRVFHG